MYPCIVCSKLVQKQNKRCRACYIAFVSIPSNTSQFKDGLTSRKRVNLCECGEKITNYSKSCMTCWGKTHSGVNGTRYKNGKSLEQRYCTECNKALSVGANFKDSKFCKVCAFKDERSPLYIHGQGYDRYPKEFSLRLRTIILKRDNYTCQGCGMTNDEHIKLYRRIIEIHHIDFNKNNCSENNLITTCKKCNIGANWKREESMKFFKNKLQGITL